MKKTNKWDYSPHFKEYAEGHINMPAEKSGCNITITGTASMSQKDVDRICKIIVNAVNKTLK